MAHFCVDCGTGLLETVIEDRRLEACPRCSYVLWRDPKVSTAVVVESAGRIVLGRRAIEPGYGLWCLPGGFVNDDEHPADAAVRECREEIRAEVGIEGLLGVFHVPKQDAPSMIVIAYHGRLVGEAAAGHEMLDVGLFPIDTVPELAFPSHVRILGEWRTRRSPESIALP